MDIGRKEPKIDDPDKDAYLPTPDEIEEALSRMKSLKKAKLVKKAMGNGAKDKLHGRVFNLSYHRKGFEPTFEEV